MNKKYSVVLWGMGVGYNDFISRQGHHMVDVIAIVDKKRGVFGFSMDGVPVITKEKIKNYGFDYIIVTVLDEKLYDEIVEEALCLGIDKSIILPVKIFGIPFFDFNDYVKIKEARVSIIADSCLAGFLYNRFGLEFNSPTINMFCLNDDYFRFISNLEKCLSDDMVEVKQYRDEPFAGTWSFPRGKVNDVEWFFQHYDNADIAIKCWNRRRQRFNWDNYIVFMTIRSDEMAYKFDELPIKHKVGFYWKDLNLKSVVCIPDWKSESVRRDYGFNFNFVRLVNANAEEKKWVSAVNWMKILLHEEGYKRLKL